MFSTATRFLMIIGRWNQKKFYTAVNSSLQDSACSDSAILARTPVLDTIRPARTPVVDTIRPAIFCLCRSLRLELAACTVEETEFVIRCDILNHIFADHKHQSTSPWQCFDVISLQPSYNRQCVVFGHFVYYWVVMFDFVCNRLCCLYLRSVDGEHWHCVLPALQSIPYKKSCLAVHYVSTCSM